MRRKPPEIEKNDAFTREELWELEARCRRMADIVVNEGWKRVYEEMAYAVCCLDAFISRTSTTPTIPKGATIPKGD